MREAASLTQRELAKKLHVAHGWVHKSEIPERRVDITEFLDWRIACDIDPTTAFKELQRIRWPR
jgi:transcriptional regulator with XRE-family HTH domain